MIYSMTGYGKAESFSADKKIIVEIKSVNSKQADVNVRMPSYYRSLETDIRKRIAQLLVRGKIDVYITVEDQSGKNSYTINVEMASCYYEEIKKLEQRIGQQSSNVIELLLKMPEVLKSEETDISEAEKQAVFETVEKAAAQTVEFRKQEGEALLKDIESHVKEIVHFIPMIEKYEKERIENTKKRLYEALQQNDIAIDENRFEQELIYYLEKYDINEEKVRLKNHCGYLLETIHSESQAVGKKINFIAQEIGREINTIGSKANHSEIQKIVVNMKDLLEKIKEQSLNVL